MSLFQIDYLKKTGALMKEAFTLKKYKAMHPAFAVFVGIFMSPFLIAGLLLTALLAVFAFVCNLILTPLSHIYSLFHNEAKDVKHATQFLIYAISWPLFFLLYFAFSWIFVVTYLLYAILSIDMYIFTLGGFKFHVFPGADSEYISIKVKGRFLALPIVTICISSVLIIAMVVFGSLAVVAYAESSELYEEYEELQEDYEKLVAANKTPAKNNKTEEEKTDDESQNNDDLVAVAAAQADEDANADAENQTEENTEKETEEEKTDNKGNTSTGKNDVKAAKAAKDAAYEEYEEQFAMFIIYAAVAGAVAAIYFLFNLLISLIGYAPRYISNGDEECCCEAAAVEAVVAEEAVVEEVAAVEEAPAEEVADAE